MVEKVNCWTDPSLEIDRVGLRYKDIEVRELGKLVQVIELTDQGAC